MMSGMRQLRQRVGRLAVRAVPVVLLAVLSAGCSQQPPGNDEPDDEPAALKVRTVSGASDLDPRARAELESAVGDVLSDYVVEAFLGEFPRKEFVSSFESFTSGAARSAAGDIERLTAARVGQATDMRATDLDARLSWLVHDRDALGATAAVRFAFEATMPDGTTRPLTLEGRLMLEDAAGTWSVFGYDVALDDGAGSTTGSAP